MSLLNVAIMELICLIMTYDDILNALQQIIYVK